MVTEQLVLVGSIARTWTTCLSIEDCVWAVNRDDNDDGVQTTS